MLPRLTFGLPQPQPGEMKQLVDENAGHFAAVGKQRTVQDDFTPPQEASRMHRRSRTIAGYQCAAVRPKVGFYQNLNRTAFHDRERQSRQQAAEPRSRREVKLHPRRHSMVMGPNTGTA